MTSIKDVAKLAGVSIMTVSRVMNAKETVSEENRSRVLKAVDALGYRPSRMARTLRSQRSHLIGLLLPNIENPIFAALAKYVEKEANRFGYNIMIANSWESRAREANSLELMLSLSIDGIIISPVSSESDHLLGKCTMPVVVLDRSLRRDCHTPVVTVDNVMVGRVAARHLLDLGHRHFACLAGPAHVDVFSDRLEGYASELRRHGFAAPPTERVKEAASVANADTAMTKLLRRRRARPLALFCVTDLAAIGAISAAKSLGLDVPGDVSVVGVDDIPSGEWITPALTTIRQPFAAVASAGVKTLVKMIDDPECRPDNKYLRPEIIVRDSSAAYGGE